MLKQWIFEEIESVPLNLARRQQDAQAKAAKRRSESVQDAEVRRQQDAQAMEAKMKGTTTKLRSSPGP